MEGMSRSPPAGSYSNGHHHKQQGGGTTTQRDHFRSRKSRQTGGRVPSGQQETEAPPCTDFDKAYFQSYSHVGIHEEMIKFCRIVCGQKLTGQPFYNIRDILKAKVAFRRCTIPWVVVDVGCGTGILSIFCAQAGAKRVYAVDASEIALQANEVVKANNLSDKVIVLHGRVEDVQIDEEVDVIISEWMGYMLLYESMLGSVIVARDRWLRPGGLILPSNAVLYMAPVTHPDRYAESIDFWRNVYGIDMSPILPLAKQCAFEEPSVETISGENVLTWPHVVKHVDCYTIRIQELESVTTKYKFQSMMRAPFHGFAFWFDVEFSGPANNDAPSAVEESPETTASVSHRRKRANPDEALVLSTAPEDPPTHWQQTMIYFYDPIDVEQDQVIEGSVTLTQSKENARFMNIHLEYASGGRSFVKECVLR
ncbi:probable protein arginine N-methyltransferase 6 isoform X2 [Cynara cardunculus var. scolymus]|uniref:probable protein arginine N-methyltransferase 6 isoform X2 n=1 Tax=Cynara cardunculus var. scolymus TaxID=59895 RepID=UPI000D6270A0|nr:probable protein arginine N-methyltransferase 6 isoform X2 [Cynara cardunculus var. scolymus]